MGFLSRRKKGIKVEAEVLASGSLLSIVGESFYKPALASTAKLAAPGKPPTPVTGRALGVTKKEPDLPWFQAVLVREPDNEYDANAIAVYSPAGKIGHLSREDAERYQPVLTLLESRGTSGACPAFLRRGSDGILGVVLALSSPETCLDELAS